MQSVVRRNSDGTSPIPTGGLGNRFAGSCPSPSTSDPIADFSDVFHALDARAHRETRDDLFRLQNVATYPASFSAIRCPAVMVHGTSDPHPGRMIRDNLRRFLPRPEYREWERCGHFLWNERAAADEFFRALRGWLRGRSRDGESGSRR